MTILHLRIVTQSMENGISAFLDDIHTGVGGVKPKKKSDDILNNVTAVRLKK